MNKNYKYLALYSAIGFFFIALIPNWVESGISNGLVNGIIGFLLFGALSLPIAKAAVKNNLSDAWHFIFYLLGWLFGFANLLFWLIMLILHLSFNRGQYFFNQGFHKRVYVWGITITSLGILGLFLNIIFK